MTVVDLKIQDVIEQTVRQRLAGEGVLDVLVTREVDFDGEAIFHVTIVLEDDAEPDPRKLSGLIRHIRGKLAEIGEDTFPILRVISKEDARLMAKWDMRTS